MRATTASISSRLTRSPSGTPGAAAIDQLAVAIARQPGSAATVRALATSQTLTSTRIDGSGGSRRRVSAFSNVLVIDAARAACLPHRAGRRYPDGSGPRNGEGGPML